MKPLQIAREGHKRALTAGSLDPQQEYIYQALQKNPIYQADLFLRRKGQEKAALGIGNIIETLYFESQGTFVGVVIPKKESEKLESADDLLSFLHKHYNGYETIAEGISPTMLRNRRFPWGMKEGTPFPFQNIVGENRGQIQKIIVPPYEELTNQRVDVPLGYRHSQYSLWLEYDAIFRILKDTFGDAVL